MARAILLAAERGLRLPIVYNTNAYDSVEVLRLLDGVIDIYLPDLKYAEDEAGYLYSKVRAYRSVSRAAIAEMFRQTGAQLVYRADGLLMRGLVIRLLVLPNDLAAIRESLEWLKQEFSPRVAISLMAQYYPTNVAGTNERYLLLSRRISETNGGARSRCWKSWAGRVGCRIDGAAYYRRISLTGRHPFQDIRDFGGEAGAS
jgi:putative pyruvate formate lyase activating enzyme